MFSNWILTVVLSIPFRPADCDCGQWNKYDEFEYCLSSDEKTYLEAQDACVEMGGYLALPKSEKSENALVKLLDGQKLNKRFYIGLSAELVWDDCTKPRQRHLQNFQVNNTKIVCTVGHFKGRNKSISWRFSGCLENDGFICERRSENIIPSDDSNVPLLGSSSSRMMPRTNDSCNACYASDAANATMSPIGFSFDLPSFLIGLAVPCPLLLAATLKIIFSARCSRRKKKKGARLSVISTTARSSYNHDSGTLPETSHDSVYLNVESGVNHQQMDGYERPIGSQSQEFIEPATYEEYDFPINDNYAY